MINEDTNVLFSFLIRYYYFSQINLRILFSFLLFSFFCKYFVFFSNSPTVLSQFQKDDEHRNSALAAAGIECSAIIEEYSLHLTKF